MQEIAVNWFDDRDFVQFVWDDSELEFHHGKITNHNEQVNILDDEFENEIDSMYKKWKGE